MTGRQAQNDNNMKKIKILLTGYGPFGKIKENITESIVKDIKNNWKYGHELKTLVMRVEWDYAEQMLMDELASFGPDLVISMGHAKNYPKLTLETRYYNCAIGEDESGKIREGGIIIADGSDIYDTNIGIKELCNYLDRFGIELGVHGGPEGMGYLCNFAGYLSAHFSNTITSGKMKHLFLHIPSQDDKDYEASLEEILKIIIFLSSQEASLRP
jgi:pyroglutamyl-peptidase